MARDLPDWHTLTAQSTVHEITDLGELAVRLCSIVSFDRRGDVVWMDCFECGIGKWEGDSSGADSAVVEDTTRSRNGNTSCKLMAGSTVDHYADINHYQPIPVLATFLGCELSFQISLAESVRLRIRIWDGTNQITFNVQYDRVNSKLQYSDSSGVWQDIVTGITLQTSQTMFHTLKVVVDPTAVEYVRVVLDSITYPLDGLSCVSTPSGASPAMMFGMRNTGRSGYNDAVYVDDAIITQNEPPNP